MTTLSSSSGTVDQAIGAMAARLRLRDYAEDVIAEIACEVRLVLDELAPDDGLCPHGFPPEFCGNCHEEVEDA